MAPLTQEVAEAYIAKLTDGLVDIKDDSGAFLMELADGSIIDTKGWNDWEWTHGVATTGLWMHYELTGSAKSLATIQNWFAARHAETPKGKPKNINTMSVMYALACMVEKGRTGEIKVESWYEEWLDDWAEWMMTDLPKTQEGGFQHITYLEVNKDQLWDDTLMMTVLPLTKIGLVLNRPHYIEEAKFQFLLHIRYLEDPQSGLWYHGWEFDANGGHNFAKALWARGNCWITLAIPTFLSLLALPPTDPVVRTLTSVLNRQVTRLAQLQDKESGLWHTLLPDPTSYVETSASAGFAAGVFMGIRTGILSADHLPLALHALQGVLEKTTDDGEVTNVSFGTGMGSTLQFYKDIALTSMPYGQALAMVALVEWEALQAAK